MILAKLPSVLHPNDSSLPAISMERALKQIRMLLEQHTDDSNIAVNDIINASIDDLDLMIMCIER